MKVKIYLFIILVFVLACSGCKKDETGISVIEPTAGKKLLGGNTLSIKWESDFTTSVIIKLYTRYSEVLTIADNISGKSYNWVIPQGVTFDQSDYMIYIQSKSKPDIYAFSKFITITGKEITYDPTVYTSLPANIKTSLYNDSFTDNANGWLTGTVTGSYNNAISGGYYSLYNLKTTGYSQYTLANKFTETTNYEVEFSLKILRNNLTNSNNGVVWGFSSSSNYIQCGISNYSNKFFADQVISGQTTSLLNVSTASILAGSYNKITIRKYNGKLYYFINETYVGQSNVPAMAGTGTGFILGPSNQISVDYLTINKIN